MRKTFLAVALSAFASSVMAETVCLTINVTGINKDTGSIIVAVFDKPDSWLSTSPNTQAFADISQAVTDESDAILVLENIPTGNYAVSVFHDVNANGELDTNFIGYPKEPFGFSAPMGMFGPPKFEKASIAVSDTTAELTIELN